LVKAGARFSYTDSDGTYRVSRLSAGRQTMSAVLDGFNVLNAGFENPVTVGPNAAGLDFVALPFSLNSITLVATGSVWKYLDTGSAPNNAWTEVAFDDSAWKTGPAKLGYGIGDEATVVGFGPNASDRFVTTWFRQKFFVDDTAVLDHLVFRLRRDDGAVVYLNGHEMYRENMPAGAVQSSTTALADITSEESTFFKRLFLPTGLLIGTNIVAVEVHQFRTNSTDLSFDLELAGVTANGQALLPRLALQRSGAQAWLVWPAGYTGWSLYTANQLGAVSDWLKSPAPVVVSNGWNQAVTLLDNASGFFQLRKGTFCSPLP
jgi:hypothetical protein